MSVPVITSLEGGVGRITLDRPRALNALTTEMVELIDGALVAWQHSGLRAVVIDSSSDHFCAGGDVRGIRELALAGDWFEVERFFRTEYRMNERIAGYAAPVLSLIDGICMGGGMGLSMHGAFRVVTERTVLAMPETIIGFVPDVGSTYFLSRLPGAMGLFLALTGYRMSAEDALALGLATHLVPSARLRELDAAIGPDSVTDLDGLLASYASQERGPSALSEIRSEIDAVFSADDVAGILDGLAGHSSPWARDAEAALRAASPLSLVTAQRLLRLGRERSLRECLDAELAAAMELVRQPDFAEGVRASLVDKDRQPVWSSAL